MKFGGAIITVMLVVAASLPAESLWDPGFSGYTSGGSSVSVGDTLLVRIETNTTLTYSSLRSESDSVTIELQGGDAAESFSFLPNGTVSANRRLEADDEVVLSALVPVRVVAVDAAGAFSVLGTRTVTLNGRTESMELSGTVSASDLGESGTVGFSHVADARLVYRSVAAVGGDVLAVDDLVRRAPPEDGDLPSAEPDLAAEASPPAAGTADTEAGAAGGELSGAASAEPGASAEPAASTADSAALTVTEERRTELIREYVNRLLDLVFR